MCYTIGSIKRHKKSGELRDAANIFCLLRSSIRANELESVRSSPVQICNEIYLIIYVCVNLFFYCVIVGCI